MTTGLQISCDFCHDPITTPGGLLFTTVPKNKEILKKEHLCAKCSARVGNILNITNKGRGKSGIYISPPLNTTSWHVIPRKLTAAETRKLREYLTHPE